MEYRNPDIELCIEEPSSLFKGLCQKDREYLDRHHLTADHAKGDYIFREGHKAKGPVCLVKGKAKIFKTGVGGREQIIKMVGPQAIVAFYSIFFSNPHPYSLSAIENSVTVTFEKRYLLRILRHSPELTLRFMKMMAGELMYLSDRMVSLTQKHVRARVAESLLLLRDTFGFEADGKTLAVLLSRNDIAHLSNMITSNAIRTLSAFASEKIIGIKGRKIMIINPFLLEHVSELG